MSKRSKDTDFPSHIVRLLNGDLLPLIVKHWPEDEGYGAAALAKRGTRRARRFAAAAM